MTTIEILDSIPDGEFHVDLARGDPIPGSKFYRDYCGECNQPLRVSIDKIFSIETQGGWRSSIGKIDPEKINYCERCDPHIPKYHPLTPRQEAVRRRQSDKVI